jgi:glucarate dehydratase
MEIRELEVIPVAHREPPLRNAWGIHSETEARTILRVTTADGAVGVGETYGNGALISQLEDARPLVEGMDAYDHKRMKLRLQRGRGRGEASGKAAAAIETALLDLVGRETGRPVYDLLGGRVRDAVEFSAYLFYKEADSDPDAAAITPGRVMSPGAMVEEAREFRDRHGFEVLKLKAGVLPPEEEVRTLELMAEEFPDASLRIDPNGNWRVETALEVAADLEERDLDLEFLEDPVPTTNAHARLKEHTRLPVATNMFVTAFDHVAPAVKMDAVDVILSDHHYWGGLRETVELDRLARTFDLSLGMHSNSHLGVSMAAMVHVAAAMPTLAYACDSHYPWEADDVVADPLEFEDGHVEVPDDPGLGVDLDEDELWRLNERYETEEPERDDAANLVQRDPSWVPNSPRW